MPARRARARTSFDTRLRTGLRLEYARCRRRTCRSSSRSTTKKRGCRHSSRRLYPALDALQIAYEIVFINDGSRDRSAALLREQFQKRPDVTRVILFNGNFGQHMAIMAGFAHCARPPRGNAGRRPAEPAGGDRQPDGCDGPGPRLRRHHPPQASGQRVPPLRFPRDEPGAGAHHAGEDDGPGLHAARLQPRHRRRHGQLARGQHLYPGAGLYLRRQPDRDRGRARRARRRGVQVFALPADPAELRSGHRVLRSCRCRCTRSSAFWSR